MNRVEPLRVLEVVELEESEPGRTRRAASLIDEPSKSLADEQVVVVSSRLSSSSLVASRASEPQQQQQQQFEQFERPFRRAEVASEQREREEQHKQQQQQNNHLRTEVFASRASGEFSGEAAEPREDRERPEEEGRRGTAIMASQGAAAGSAGGPSESMKLNPRNKSASSSKSSINSENLYTKNLTFLQLFKRSILKNVLLVSTIVAVFLGFLIGMIMRHSHGQYSKDVIHLVAFPGDMFLRMLKMLILPLIIASVISALASLDSTVSGKIGMRACMFYMTTTVIATITGIILVTLIHPGDVKMKEGFDNTALSPKSRGKGSTMDAVTDLVRSIIPDNIVAACFQHSETIYRTEEVPWRDEKGIFRQRNETVRKYENREGANVLGLMFFCCVFGVICSKLGEKAEILVKFFQALDHTVMQMVLLAMYFSPIGIMSLIIEKLLVIEDIGETMSRLGMYMVTVIVGLILHGFISVPGMYAIATRKNPLTFMRQCTECIVFAIGTGSSTATLPVTFKCLEENVKCDTRITRFVLPIGATINMDGTALYEAVAAIFIGQMNGMVFTFPDLIIISLTSTAASFGAAAVPSAGLVTMIMVLTAVGLPTEDITMIVAVDWFLDRIRTAVNVLSDGYVSGIVAHLSKDELERYDAEHGGRHPELTNQLPAAVDPQWSHNKGGPSLEDQV